MRSVWAAFGLRGNPFADRPIRANESGPRLLVGRDDEVGLLLTRLASSTSANTVEGPNGVGKTSLSMVAAHVAESNGIDAGTPFILCREPLFLEAHDTATTFELRALGLLANNILASKAPTEEAGGVWPLAERIQDVLEDCAGDVFELDVSVLRDAVRAWLTRFEEANPDGAFIMIIDNLEVAATVNNPRVALEAVRDTVLALPAVRWIICGTPGAVRGIVSSPRLYGRLFEPLRLQPVPPESASEVLGRRYATLAISGTPDPPISGGTFQLIYGIVGHDLRAALSLCEGFVTEAWEDIRRLDSDERAREFVSWVRRVASVHAASLETLPEYSQKLVEDLGQIGGSWRATENQLFGATSLDALRTMVAELADAAMVVVEDVLDEDAWSFRLSTQGHLAYAYAQGHLDAR